MKLHLENKVAFVSGGSKGIGREIARELYVEGASVMISARRESLLAEAKQYIESAEALGGARVAYVVADMTIEADVKRAIEETRKVFGPPQIVVANVLQSKHTFSFNTCTNDDLRQANEELIVSIASLFRETSGDMIKNNYGRFVNLGGVSTKEPHRWHNLYTNNIYRVASVAFTRTLANEHAKFNLTVNTVSPGFIDTGVGTGMMEQAKLEGHPQVETFPAIMAGRPGTCDEISGLVAFLCSERGSYITGQNLIPDGGWTRAM